MYDQKLPLRNRERKTYCELYAKFVLEYLFPDEYINLIHQDRPDLLDMVQNIGIEVTQAINQESAAAINEWVMSLSELDEKKRAEHIRRIEYYSEMYQNDIKAWRENACSLEEIRNAINHKCKKYATYPYDILDLFVDTVGNYEIEDEYELEFLAEDVLGIIDELKVPYRYVYLVIVGYVYRFDARNSIYKVYSLAAEKAKEIGMRARECVLESKKQE